MFYRKGTMEITAVQSFVAGDALTDKQAAERRYDEARAAVTAAQLALADARTAVRDARAEKVKARLRYEDSIRADRKPRQKNVVRRVLESLKGYDNGRTRRDIISGTGLDATSVSTTLTRCKRVGFVARSGDEFAGLWVITDAGWAWLESDEPMPKN